jgi:hypothetical protein
MLEEQISLTRAYQGVTNYKITKSKKTVEKAFGRMKGVRVAQSIYRRATGRTDRVRYAVGESNVSLPHSVQTGFDLLSMDWYLVT